MEIREKLAREILVQNWDGSRETAEYAWDNNTGEIEKAVYYEEADIYLAILCAEIKKMGLSDEELWAELNKLFEYWVMEFWKAILKQEAEEFDRKIMSLKGNNE